MGGMLGYSFSTAKMGIRGFETSVAKSRLLVPYRANIFFSSYILLQSLDSVKLGTSNVVC